MQGRITNIILGIAFVVSVLFMIYENVKSIEADTQRVAAEVKVHELTLELQKCQQERTKSEIEI